MTQHAREAAKLLLSPEQQALHPHFGGHFGPATVRFGSAARLSAPPEPAAPDLPTLDPPPAGQSGPRHFDARIRLLSNGSLPPAVRAAFHPRRVRATAPSSDRRKPAFFAASEPAAATAVRSHPATAALRPRPPVVVTRPPAAAASPGRQASPGGSEQSGASFKSRITHKSNSGGGSSFKSRITHESQPNPVLPPVLVGTPASLPRLRISSPRPSPVASPQMVTARPDIIPSWLADSFALATSRLPAHTGATPAAAVGIGTYSALSSDASTDQDLHCSEVLSATPAGSSTGGKRDEERFASASSVSESLPPLCQPLAAAGK